MATPQAVTGLLQAGSKTVIKTEGAEKEITVAARYDILNPEGLSPEHLEIDPNVLVKVGDEYVVYTQVKAKDDAGINELAAIAKAASEDKDYTEEKARVSNFNYGWDLNVKRMVRGKHEEKVKGPEKTINSTVKGLMALGYTKEEAEALAKAKQPQA